MTTNKTEGNGWSQWEKKVLGDLKRLEENQVRLFTKQEDHSVALATLFARMSMLAAGIASGVSLAFRIVPLMM